MHLRSKQTEIETSRFLKNRRGSFTCLLLSFVLYWNVIQGIFELLSRFSYLGFLSQVAAHSEYISLLFIICTAACIIKDNRFFLNSLIPFLWIPAFAISFLLLPELQLLAKRACIYYALNVICLTLLLIYVVDLDLLLGYLRCFIPISIIYAVLRWITYSGDESYSMVFSYSSMVPALLCLVIGVREKGINRMYIVAFALFLAVNLKCGSRGCILCFAIAVIFLFAFMRTGKKYVYLSMMIAILIIIIANWDSIIFLLQKALPESRSIRLLANGLAFYDAGRGAYYQKLINAIFENPFRIRGLYSDRFLLASDPTDINVLWGSYAHNIILEILYQFGIWGIPAIVFIAVRLIDCCIYTKRQNTNSIIIIETVFFSYAIGQLAISSSYLIAPSFGVLIGVLCLFSNKSGGLRNE